MLQRKKKPVQYFFVDINDPDYYKRIKVAQACTDCRKRKSKCDIGKPGSGPCSSCRKHNKVCEFTSSTIVPSIPSASSCQVSVNEKSGYEKLNRRHHSIKLNQRRRVPMVSRQNRTASPRSSSSINKYEVSIDLSDESDSQSFEDTATQGSTHFVGQWKIELPDIYLQQEETELPITPPLSLLSHSISSSAATTPSLHTDYADGYIYPWNSNAAPSHDETPLHSVSLMDPIEIKPQLLASSSSSTITLESNLFHLYFERIHHSFPVLSLNLRHSAPSCIKYAILALSSLYYYDQHQPSTMNLSHEYYIKALTHLHARGINDLISAQTLLILYKYHETLGQPNEPFLEHASSVLEHYSRTTVDAANDYQDNEWLCRLLWIVYLCHFNGSSSTLCSTWEDPPTIRLPCLLPSEQHDQDQVKAVSQLIDTIHTANIYTTAMQSLCLSPDDHWTLNH
ncbi:hypothetical protein BC941DRAFT_513584 [Chlamydoabsidia padenii]|nr:hypothetical protein BC941DRAFT_513584 [Chlamydoabsidia padenii]